MKRLLCFFLLAGFFSATRAQVLNTNFCQTNGSVNAVAIDSVNNVVYIGGTFSQVCGQPRNRLAAMDLTSGSLLSWNPGCNNQVQTMYIHKNALYIGGYFTTVGGQSHKCVAKFYLPSGTLSTWNPNITMGSSVNAIVAKDNHVYVGGDILMTVGTGNQICDLDTGTAIPTSWAAYPNNIVQALAIDGNHLYAGGNFTQVGSTPINYMAKFYLSSSGGDLSTSFDALADGAVSALLAQSGRVFVSGAFSFLSAVNREKLAEVDSSSGAALTWNPGADNPVYDMKYRNGMIYVVGNIANVGGRFQNFISALDANTGHASRWNINTNTTLWKTATTSNQIFIGGSMTSVLGQTRNSFAVVCINPIDTITNAPQGPATVCAGLSGVTYTVDPVAGATSYAWSYSGTGVTVVGTGSVVTLNFSAAATNGSLSVYATNGCESSNTLSLSISTYTFDVNISGSTSMICGDSVNLNASDNYQGGGTITYSWTPSAGLNTTTGTSVMSGTKSTKTYTVTATSTEGCLSKDSITISVNPISLTLNSYLPNILCSTKDTLYASNDYPGAGTVTYTWSPAGALNLTNPSKPIASPVTTTDYTLVASSSDGCVAAAQAITVFVDPITLNTNAAPATITCGNTTTLSVGNNYPGGGSISYTWSPSAVLTSTNTASTAATLTAAITFTVDILTTEGCVSSATQYVNVDPLQINTSGSYNSTCGNPVTLSTSENSGNAGLTYSWSPAAGLTNAIAASPQANVSTTTIFTVTMSLPGCSDAVAYDTVKIAAPATPSICEISSDSLSQYNILYWDKSGYQTTDSFIVYREVITNVYSRIASIPYTALSMYTDTARSIGPANGDPNVGSYRYKLAVKDSCGNVSALSPYHNTVFFVDNHTGAFTWNKYDVEFQATPVTQFNLLRDDNNTGAWHVIGVVTGNNTTLNDAAYATYQSVANWRVEALGFNCTPTARYSNNNAQSAVVKSKSNITNNRQIGVKNNAGGSISIYPNPSQGTFEIVLGATQGETQVRIFSVLGEEVLSGKAKDKLSVDLSAFEDGTYIVQLSNEQRTITRRIIKN